MKYQVTKDFYFSAAHRLYGYEGNCKFLHGHEYHVFITLESDVLDGLGMVVDFKEFKKVKEIVMTNFDHATLVNSLDKPLLDFLPDQRFYIFSNENPTAEIMARTIYMWAQMEFGDKVKSVKLYETATSMVEVIREAC